MNIRSIKRRNDLKLKRSAGRGWSAAALALPVFYSAINEYRDFVAKQLIAAFGLTSQASTPSIELRRAQVLANMNESVNAVWTELTTEKLKALGLRGQL
jgi:hypothetical protein